MPAPNVPYRLFGDIEDIRRKADQLVALVQSHLSEPEALAEGEIHGWQHLLGPALLAKAAGTLASMMLLLPSRRDVDALTMARSLFENVVVFAWIAVEPDGRVGAWYRTSYYWELQEHKDWEQAGRGLKTPAEAEELVALMGRKRERLPIVPVMAAAADEHWGHRVVGWSPSSEANHPGVFSSLRGLYRYIYRRGSAATHSCARGLDPFVSIEGSTVTVHAEAETSDLHPYELGLIALSFAIGASEKSLGWPSWREAARILGREQDLVWD